MEMLLTWVGILLLMAMVFPSAARSQAPRPGGYTTTSVTNQEVMAAAAFAIAAQDKRGGQTGKLELVEILEAQCQVVAGVNYRLILKVKGQGSERTAEAVVWWQAWRKPGPYQLTSWNWK